MSTESLLRITHWADTSRNREGELLAAIHRVPGNPRGSIKRPHPSPHHVPITRPSKRRRIAGFESTNIGPTGSQPSALTSLLRFRDPGGAIVVGPDGESTAICTWTPPVTPRLRCYAPQPQALPPYTVPSLRKLTTGEKRRDVGRGRSRTEGEQLPARSVTRRNCVFLWKRGAGG